MPAVARHRMEAYDGQIYTVDCHVGERFGRIGFLSQAPGSHQYLMHQNFCTCTLVETGEKGHAMFEWGWRSIA